MTTHPLVEDFYALATAEERLEWICERVPQSPPLTPEQCTPDRRVPHCLSGVWIWRRDDDDGRVRFYCRAESPVVGAIAALLCDICSGHRLEDLPSLMEEVVTPLRLDTLLTTNRKRAVDVLCKMMLSGPGPTSPAPGAPE
jgi:sulfur transfer protein SufE